MYRSPNNFEFIQGYSCYGLDLVGLVKQVCLFTFIELSMCVCSFEYVALTPYIFSPVKVDLDGHIIYSLYGLDLVGLVKQVCLFSYMDLGMF